MSDLKQKEIKNILFETGVNVDSDDDQEYELDTQQPTDLNPTDNIDYSSDEDKMKELDLQILKQLQLRKQKMDKYRQQQSATRKLVKFPNDFSNEKMSSQIEDNFTEQEKSTLSKLRYDIHRAIYKLSKNKKLQRINEIPLTFSNYPDSAISQSMLSKIQGELTSRGFGCEISAERVHTVKYKSRGVIISVIIK